MVGGGSTHPRFLPLDICCLQDVYRARCEEQTTLIEKLEKDLEDERLRRYVGGLGLQVGISS